MVHGAISHPISATVAENGTGSSSQLPMQGHPPGERSTQQAQLSSTATAPAVGTAGRINMAINRTASALWKRFIYLK